MLSGALCVSSGSVFGSSPSGDAAYLVDWAGSCRHWCSGVRKMRPMKSGYESYLRYCHGYENPIEKIPLLSYLLIVKPVVFHSEASPNGQEVPFPTSADVSCPPSIPDIEVVS